MITFNRLPQIPIHSYERYLPTAFDESLTLVQKVNKLIEHYNSVAQLSDNMIDYLNDFVERFDSKLYVTLTDVLKKWADDGVMTEIVNNLFVDYSDIMVNVKSLGIRPETDITERLNSVLSGAHKTFFFPSGEYWISDVVRLPKGVTILGDKDVIFKRINNKQRVMFVNGEMYNWDYASGYDGDGDISIINCTFDLNVMFKPLPEETENTSCFNFGHASNIHLKNVTIKNGQNGHFIQIAGCRDVLLENCTFKNQYHVNKASNNYECVQIESINTSSFPYFGSGDNTPSKNVELVNCIFDNVIRGVGTHSFPKNEDGSIMNYQENIIIDSCEFKNTINHAITLWGFDFCQIRNCLAENIGHSFVVTNMSKNVTIEKNRLKNIFAMILNVVLSHTFKLIGNYGDKIVTSTSTTYSCIRIEKSFNNIIADNTIESGGHQYFVTFLDNDENINSTFRNNIFPKGVGSGVGGQYYHPVASKLKLQNWGGGETEVLMDDSNVLEMEGNEFLFDKVLYAYNSIVIYGNSNSSTQALMQFYIIPKDAILVSSVTGRYRMQTTINPDHFIEFHFELISGSPNIHKIVIDRVGEEAKIRKIVGVR